MSVYLGHVIAVGVYSPNRRNGCVKFESSKHSFQYTAVVTLRICCGLATVCALWAVSIQTSFKMPFCCTTAWWC